MKHREEKDELLISYLSGSASEQERLEALNYIHANEENKARFEEMKKYYQLSLLAVPASEFNKEQAWGRVSAGYYKQLYGREKQRNNQQIVIILKQFALPIAASLLIVFLIGALVNNIFNNASTNLSYNEITAPYGSKSMITLPDSTKVWLNSGSKLRYASSFSGKNREVFLEGEAFFDVIKSGKNIFVVNTSDIRVNVYGTEFNVKSYPDEQEIITTLVTGSVSIVAINPNTLKESIIIRPNQSATFYKATQLPDSAEKRVTIEEIEPRVVSSWKDSIWVIRGEELGKLAVKLERRFNVNISFENEGLKNYKFSGSLTEETFEQVMKIIKTSAPINFSVENNHVIIKEDKLFKERYDSLLQRK